MGIGVFRPVAMTACALLVLAGCGGGGGGSSGGGPKQPDFPLTISISQNPITASFAQFDLPAQVAVTASVQGTTTASTVYVVIVDPAGTFANVSSVGQTGSTQYAATLTLADTLSVGDHTGTLSISLCSDAQCANTLGKTSAAYVVTVKENPVLTGTWAPASLVVTSVKDDREVTWKAGFVSARPQTILYARVTDAAGVVSVAGDSQTILTTAASNDVTLKIAPSVAAGTHSGNLDLVFCRDRDCKKMYGGVTRLPYSVSVVPITNLRPLVSLPGAADWTTVQGGAAHTGYVPVTLNPADFAPRWLWLRPDPQTRPDLFDAVTTGGKVFTIMAPNPTVHEIPVLVAIDEQTGVLSWQQQMPDTDNGGASSFGLGALTAPAIAGDTVYAVRTVNTFPPQEGQFMGFRASDGAPRFAPVTIAETPAQFGDYFYDRPFNLTNIRPGYLTPANGAMLLAGVDANGTRSFVSLDSASGARTARWAGCPVANSLQYGAALALDATGAAFIASNIGLVLADSCTTIDSVPLSNGFGPAVVPGSSDVVVVGGGNLVNFDTAAGNVKWSMPATDTNVFIGSPAIAGSTLYVQNSGTVQLEARSEQDGKVLWTWSPGWKDETAFLGNVVATQNIVFVSTRNRVYAIDTSTHQTVWTYPYGGTLSLSANGVLYVMRRSGPGISGSEGLAAINLH